MIALVTGGSRGIGAATVLALARDGFDIWLVYHHDHDAAQKVAVAVEALGHSCRLLCFDVGDAVAVTASLEPLLEHDTPHVLVNNAGFSRDTLMVWMTQEEWDDVLGVHLGGFFLVTKAVLRNMLGKKAGRIINIASTSGQSGTPGQVNYSAAKAGLIGATRALAQEVAKRHILVNAVSPGFIDTEMLKNLPAPLMERIMPMIPLGRLGTPEEVAEVVSFLASPRASYITGQVIAVNGGVYMG
ncbi:MAG: 3-oxoacyl-ACP reductase FabG [bacterium]